MQNLGSFSKGWRGSEDLRQDPKFFRTYMGGVLKYQKYSLTQSIQLMNIAEWIVFTILEDINVLKFKKSGTCTKDVGCI